MKQGWVKLKSKRDDKPEFHFLVAGTHYHKSLCGRHWVSEAAIKKIGIVDNIGKEDSQNACYQCLAIFQQWEALRKYG